ncbi:MAG: hypothetical protein IT175_06205 [Acidobacteria bacterium]|nr:hypothetical protein [Acidobacteriota bacterium]
MRHLMVRVSVPAAAVAVACGITAGAYAVGQLNPPRFITPLYAVGGAHPTSGLAGFPARDYMSRGGALVRAPFSGCVPSWRPWGRLSYQAPSLGFGGSRIYLERTKTGDEAYLAHFGLNHPYGDLFLRPGQCFRQGDPVGIVWGWPSNPGRSHIHMGYQGGDPLYELVSTDGTFRIHEGPVWQPGPDGRIFPRPILRHEGKWWRVQVGDRRVYQGGETKARQVYNQQKLARTINLWFRRTYKDSPLVGWGLPMVRISRRYGIDPRLPAAIASCETSGGTKGGGPAVNNDFGLLVRGGDHRQFRSRKQAILYLAKLLDHKYVSRGLDTIAEIGGRYAPAGASNDPDGKNHRWVGCVTRVYVKLHGTRFV